MSQNQLAYEAGVTREFVNKVESGKYNISVKNLEKLAQILEVDVKEFFTQLNYAAGAHVSELQKEDEHKGGGFRKS